MTDIVDRLTHEIDYAQGILIEDALCAMEDARDEIVRLRLEVELQKDDILRYQQANAYNSGEAARMRALVAEWAEADSANDFMADDTAAIRYARAMEALREEANR